MDPIAPDLVKDVVFGATMAVSGIVIVSAALKKALADAVAFFVFAASTYGTFYL